MSFKTERLHFLLLPSPLFVIVKHNSMFAVMPTLAFRHSMDLKWKDVNSLHATITLPRSGFVKSSSGCAALVDIMCAQMLAKM